MRTKMAQWFAQRRRSMQDPNGNLTTGSRLVICLVISGLYAVMLPAALGEFGDGALDLVALPVAAVAALFGIGGGFIACVVGLAFDASVVRTAGLPIAAAINIPHVLALIGPSFSFGLMHRFLYRSRAGANDLRRSQATLQQVLRNAPLILNAFDAEGRFTVREGRALAQLGQVPGEHVGRSARDHFRTVYPEQPELVTFLEDALGGADASGEIVVRDRTEDIHFAPIRGVAGAVTGAVMVAMDVTEQRAFERDRERRATHDSLTDLPNQPLLDLRLAQEVTRGEQTGAPFALIVIDLDNFKDVNNTFGYAVGDTVLREVAARLRSGIEPNDVITRLGGDQFGLLVSGVDEHLAVEVAERMLASFARPLDIGGHPVDLSASIGVALFPRHGSETKTLWRRADAAMYAAKRTRRAYAVYSPQRDEPDPDTVRLVAGIREAIERDEIGLAFQPEVRIADRALVRVEALARWTHPELGPISPARFIGLAERTGLIGPLTRRVLSAALRQSRVWRDAGLDTVVAVNMSAHDLEDPESAVYIEQQLLEHRLPSSALALEITESVLMSEVIAVAPRIAALRAIGVSVEIDDFGTGYSSLAYLSRLPVDGIKIDRSFIQRITTDPGSRAVVRAAVQLGHELGLRVVAEGVETAAEWNEVAELGCDAVQGYFISRPVTGDALRAWAVPLTRALAGAHSPVVLSAPN